MDKRYGTRLFPKTIIVLVYVALSLLFCSNFFSWKNLSSHCMIEGDPALNAWALQWVTRATYSDPVNLFNGNAFYPFEKSIALSEHMFSLGMLNGIVRLFSDNPWVGYNLLIFIAYLLSALGGYQLTEYITSSKWVGFWGGLFFGFLYFRVHHIGHLQILSFQWIPYSAYYWLRFLEKRDNRSLILFGIFFMLQCLVSWYLAVITSAIILIGFSCFWRRPYFDRPFIKKMVVAFLSMLLIFVPFILPYYQNVNQSTLKDRFNLVLRSGDNVHVKDYLFPPDSTWIGREIPDNPYWIWNENTLYIGYVPLLLSLFLFGSLLFKGAKALDRPPLNSPRKFLLFGLMLCAAGFILSKGFYSREIGTHLPLYYLTWIVPFLRGLRCTQRFSLLIYLGIMILSSLGLFLLLQHFKSALSKFFLMVLFCLLFLIEVYPLKLPLNPNHPFSWSPLDYKIKEIQSKQARPLIILNLPIYYFIQSYPTSEATYMVRSTLHWAKILNGFSGELPKEFMDRMHFLNTFPSANARHVLRTIGVDGIALTEGLSPDKRRQILAEVRKSREMEIMHLSEKEQLVMLKYEYVE